MTMISVDGSALATGGLGRLRFELRREAAKRDQESRG